MILTDAKVVESGESQKLTDTKVRDSQREEKRGRGWKRVKVKEKAKISCETIRVSRAKESRKDN